VKYIPILLLISSVAIGQTGTASIAGTIVDGKTQKPVPAALVVASRATAPPFSRNTKSGGDGVFRIQGLTPGNYSICVQVTGDRYLDPCQWSAAVGVVLASARPQPDSRSRWRPPPSSTCRCWIRKRV